ncbi:MAG: heavy-metal-associated domain-containing protein [Flavobacteriaceae bacterium]
MEQKFTILGMTCEGCQKTVSSKIGTLDEVQSVEVSLEDSLALIKTESILSSDDISKVLGSKYKVQNTAFLEDSPVEKSKLRQLVPLLLIFTYLVVGTLFFALELQATPQKTMLIFMGLFFIVFSFFKFLDYRGFPASFANYDPLAQKSLLYAKIYPFLETLLGIAFLLEWQLQLTLVVTLVLLSLTAYGVLRALLKKSTIECACLGTALKLPMTEATLIENSIMIVMASILLMEYII